MSKIRKSKTYKCEICGQVIALRAFGTHLKKHKMTSSEYWNIYPYPYPEPEGEYGIDYVLCPVCNNKRTFQSLTFHLQAKHNMSVEEFINAYPEHKLFTTHYSEEMSKNVRIALKNDWENPEYRERHSQRMKGNKNNTKRTPEGIEHQRQVLSARLKELWQDPEYRSKMSKLTADRHKDGSLDRAVTRGFRKGWVKYESPCCGTITLKSSWEVMLARFLDEFGYKYRYEKLFRYYNSSKRQERNYLADFYLLDYNLVIEVKATWALNNQGVRDKMQGVIRTGTKFMFFTERELGCLVSKEKFEELIQSKINEQLQV